RTSRQFGFHLQIGFPVGGLDADLQSSVVGFHLHLRVRVAVAREDVSEDLHHSAVGVAAKDLQASELRMAWPFEPGENSITTQEEVSAEKSRKSLGAQVLGLDQGDSQEGEVLVGIELESGANQALQRCRRQR